MRDPTSHMRNPIVAPIVATKGVPDFVLRIVAAIKRSGLVSIGASGGGGSAGPGHDEKKIARNRTRNKIAQRSRRKNRLHA